MIKIVPIKSSPGRLKVLGLILTVLVFLTGPVGLYAQDDEGLMDYFFETSEESSKSPDSSLSSLSSPPLPPVQGAVKPPPAPVAPTPPTRLTTTSTPNSTITTTTSRTGSTTTDVNAPADPVPTLSGMGSAATGVDAPADPVPVITTPMPSVAPEASPSGLVSTSATEGYFDSTPPEPRGSSPVKAPEVEVDVDVEVDVPSPFVDPFGPKPTETSIFKNVPPLLPNQVEGPKTVPLGRGQALPPTQWESMGESGVDSSHYLTGEAQSDFDSSQGQWLQLEVGQTDRGGVFPEPAPARVTTIPTVVGTSPEDKVIDQAMRSPTVLPLESAEKKRLRLLFSDMTTPGTKGARAGGNQPQPALPSSVPPPAGPSVSAILQAGGLLTLESQVGRAEILVPGAPLKSPPLTTPAVPEVKAAVTVKPATTKVKPATTTVKPATPQIPSRTKARSGTVPLPPVVKPTPKRVTPKATPKVYRRAKARPAPAEARTQAGLMIINETGQPGVGQNYYSVLKQIGFRVVSLGQGTVQDAGSGLTIINYRPGYVAQAQSVARHLPGKKVLVEAKRGQVLASEIMVYLR